MIIINFNKPDYEYDVHSLMKAFYPAESVQMYYTCPEQDAADRYVACTHHELTDETRKKLEDAEHLFTIDYLADEISIVWRHILASESCDIAAEGCHTFVNEECRVPIAGLKRPEIKNALKNALYELLEKGSGQKLPWGTLTGIRPTKIPMKLLEEGKTDAEIFSYMKETYLAGEEKIQLSIDIAKRERKLLSKLDYKNGYSLYIGIPFCPSTCLYCSFTSYPLGVWKTQVDKYLDALEKELDYVAESFRDKTLNSVYIGGGTPTTLEPYQLERLITKIRGSFDLSACVEFTVEAGRPDSITKEKLLAIYENGVGRISVNPQTMKQQTLDLIGRYHTVEDTIQSFQLAREVGFTNINMDLIMGLPEETLEDVRHTMEVLQELAPENITIHSLAIKRAARLTIFKERYQDMQMVNTQAHMDLCAEYCSRMGLSPYYLYRQKGMAGNMENVGYAKPGKAGVYNILIMEEKQTIVACGAGASTKRVWAEVNPDGTHRIERCENVKDVALYIEKIDEMIERKRKLFRME